MKNMKINTVLITIMMVSCVLAGCLGGSEDEVQELAVPSDGNLVIAYAVQDDYENIDENPQLLADYLAEKMNYQVSLYNVDSEGAMIEALRFGNADIAIMDGGAAWVGW